MARSSESPTDRLTLFLPGAFGDGPWYNGLIAELRTAGGPVEVISWGRPKIAFAANFSDPTVHAKAEHELAARLGALPASLARVHLVGHSAGCGVILGALARTNRSVDNVVLIAPSVSPSYPVQPQRVVGKIHVFHSHRDITFLRWRTGTFGTYDGIKTTAAGHGGFDLSNRDDATLRKLIHHPYDPAWARLGNDGGHGGGTARQFVREVISPLLRPHDQPR